MTRGTILIVGPTTREAEVVTKRLEREGFSVDVALTQSKLNRWLKTSRAQAVFFTCSPTAEPTKKMVRQLRNQYGSRFPLILLTDDAPAAHDLPLSETFRLHELPIAHAVRRLLLAIQLSQLALDDV